jgi:hypothetical protein
MALEHYEAIGTMTHALDYHAEKAYGELRDDRQRVICEKVFQAITDKGTDARGIRRPTRAATLCEISGATLDELASVLIVFRKPSRSFVMPPAPEALTPETVVDISHESLMRIWNRLKNWVEREAESAGQYFRLIQNSNLHAESKAGLMTDPELSLTLEWQKTWKPNATWAKRYHPDFESAMQFLEYSRIARDAVLQAAEEDRKRELSRTRQAAMVLGLAFVVALALAIFAFLERSRAQHEETVARAQYQAELARDAAQRAVNVQLEKASQLQNDTDAQKDTQRDKSELDAATAAVEDLSAKAAQEAAQALAVMGAGRLIDTNQISRSDLFDMSAGTQVTGTSGVMAGSNPNAMFDGVTATGAPSGAATMFADKQPVGTNHWIEWQTKSDVTVKSVAIYAEHLPLRARRALSDFKLYAKQQGKWVELAEFRPSLPYAGNCLSDFCKDHPAGDKFLSVCINVDKPVSANEYRAEFEQAVSSLEGFSGPQVLQLDGFTKSSCGN